MFKVIVGPVKASKSKALIDRYLASDKTVLYSAKASQCEGYQIKSRGHEIHVQSQPISNMIEILCYSQSQTKTILIDEIQFINVSHEELRTILTTLDEVNIDLIVYGLDMDYTGKPFPTTALCMAMADEVIKMNGYCDICGHEKSTMSLRCRNGKPVDTMIESELIALDNSDEITYKSVCRHCYDEANMIYSTQEL